MQHIDLNGTQWTLSHEDGRNWPAQVPGCSHTDLLAAEEIPDPWYRDNETEIHWVWKEDWIWDRSFELSAEHLANDAIDLVCEGLDTFAEVWVNDESVLSANNMFRTWRTGVKKALRVGSNTIRVRVNSPFDYMQQRDAEKRLPGWNIFHEDFWGRSYVRKMGCAYGWDWGLMAPAAGIWRPIRLEAYSTRIADLRLTQEHRDNGTVAVVVDTLCEGTAAASQEVIISRNGTEVTRQSLSINGTKASATVEIPDPQLWWPNGLGEQALYDVTVVAHNESGAESDQQQRRIGLRQLELIREPDEFGESFRFRCNGLDFFSKGGNWIPCDVFPSRISDETYFGLVKAMADAHMNMVRVWGGGIYEDKRFYNACDELGILVWQDFMFACSTYPGFDKDWLENVRAEAIDNVRAIRHHASLAIWCGNNEIEQGLVTDAGWNEHSMSWEDYKPIFDEIIPEVVAAEDGVTPYWPSSCHTPGEGRHNCYDANSGDVHSWSVWFGGQPFEQQRTWNFRFMSEFGFQSFPEPRTVEAYTKPEDRNLTSWIMDYHQRSGPGNQTIYKYLTDWFLIPKDFEHTLWLTQLSHGLCVQYAADHARRIQGRMDGLLYWQINDIWPGATWASIDAYGRWKALQYMAKRFFAPTYVSLLEDRAAHSVEVHCSNQAAQDVAVQVHWCVGTCSGEILLESSRDVSISAQSNNCVTTIDCTPFATERGTEKLPLEIRGTPNPPSRGDRELLVWSWVTENGVEVSRNVAFFAKPKHLNLQKPTFTPTISALADGSYEVVVASDLPAPWTRVELAGVDASYSDNWFHTAPQLPSTIIITPKEAMSLEAFTAALKVVALVDYWS